MKILTSKSTNRVIFNDGSMTITAEGWNRIRDTYKKILHAAPIFLEQMSNSFSNEKINDWIEEEL